MAWIVILAIPHRLQDLETIIPENTKVEESKSMEEQILETMTPEEKVGQLFIMGIPSTTLSKETKQFLTNDHIGGVILFTKNISNEKQLKQLILNIQATDTIPLFVAVDQEGGVVSRIKWNDILTIAQTDIQTPQQAYSIAKDRGDILRSYGFNMNMAPVAEYITNTKSFLYNRVFRGTQDEVIQKSIYSINGYKDAEIISVTKHFPGHGDQAPDSHNTLPMVNISDSDWNIYIRPFSEVLANTTVDALMVGHIEFTKIDKNPATLSKEIITTRLIDGLNYNGLVITDDMGMGALNNLGNTKALAVKALNAGNDILLYSQTTSNGLEIQKEAYNEVLNEVKNRKLNIDDKVLKILKIKIKYGILKVQDK